MMNYPVWPDSAGVAGYSRALLGQSGGGMRSSLAPPPPPPPAAAVGTSDEGGQNNNTNKCNPPKYNVTNGGTDPIQRSANHHSSSSAAGGSSSSSSARLNNGDDCGSGGGGSGGGARGHQLPSADKYAPLSSFTDDDSLLKVATHFLSGGNGQGRHYMPIARDYSTLSYSSGVSASTAGSYCNSGQQQHQQQQQQQQVAALSLERPGGTARNPHSSDGGGPGAGSRISSASSSDNGGQNTTAGAGHPNPLLSPCSVMEEASSPGSTTSQLSYLGALQSPANSGLTPLGFPAPYLLSKDGAGLAAAAAAAAAQAAHAAQQVGHGGHSGGHGHSGHGSSGISGTKQKKEPKPGSDVRSFGCQVCGRGFKQKATLAQHERTHTDERPFDCPDCHKRFRQQSHLVQHLRIHSDERPYGCTYCEKAFRQKAILNQHIRIHTGEKPYVCPQCTKCFRQKAILNQHIRTHSGKRPYSCPDAKCKKKFVDQASMEKHFKKHIEDDQQQLLAEARGGPGMRSTNAGGRNNAKGLLRVKLNNSDRPATTFSRVLAPGAGGISTQDRATSPFPINMMTRPGQNNNNNNAASGAPTPAGTASASPERMADTPAASRIELASHEGSYQQAPPTYLTHHGHHHHHQAAAAAAAASNPASGPYHFVPFPHRPYHYDLLSLGSMGQSMYGGGGSNNKMAEQHAAKYRSDALGEASHNQQMGGVMDKDCVGANNNMATNYTVNGSVQKDSVP